MNEAQVPGLSIAIVNDGKVAWRRGFGVKDIRSKQRVGTQTVFEAASTSKPVFAYAVMKLCERGVMDLDTPLTKYTSGEAYSYLQAVVTRLAGGRVDTNDCGRFETGCRSVRLSHPLMHSCSGTCCGHSE